MTNVLLETKGLTKYFGGLCAVGHVDMHVNEDEIVGLIGPNGAGKTTFFNLITGVTRPTKGQVLFDGKDITFKKSHDVAKLGIGRTFQLVAPLRNFTVQENVVASFYLRAETSLWSALLKTSTYRKKEEAILKQTRDILRLTQLIGVEHKLADQLPHGYQKLLGLARALALKPRLLLLDEPVGGMTPEEIRLGMEVIRKVHSQGIAILLVEHNMQVMELCDRIIVLNFGNKIAEGLPEEVRENKDVIQAYFGVEHNA
jgi:branched-chain amino acid transport system ATP-binding protein